MTIKPIPTIYKGIQFRSRLEADWARFFDEHGVKWSYEAEGYDIDGVWYLPDFWLLDSKTFVEVKGILDDKGADKIWRLSRAISDPWEIEMGRGILVVLAEAPAGKRFRAITDHYTDLAFGVCRECHCGFFIHLNGSWKCRCCGAYDGDGLFTFYQNSEGG